MASDTERLDWWEQNMTATAPRWEIEQSATEFVLLLVETGYAKIPHVYNRHGVFLTLREAIDAAMELAAREQEDKDG